MSGDELDAAARDLVGRSDGLLRIAGVILDDSLNLLSQHPTGSIEVAYGHFETALHLLAEGRVLPGNRPDGRDRSEEHTSELQSLMRISYAVFCLKKTIILLHSYTSKLYYDISIHLT